MSKPWRPDVEGLPTDAELDRVSAREVARRKTEVKKLVADPEVYTERLHVRGHREDQERWVLVGKGKFKRWKLMQVLNRSHTASAAVNEGSVKAIRTTLPASDDRHLGSLPQEPTVGWLKVVDKRTEIDQGRKQTLANQREPLRGDTADPEDLQAQEEMAARGESGRTPSRKTGEDAPIAVSPNLWKLAQPKEK